MKRITDKERLDWLESQNIKIYACPAYWDGESGEPPEYRVGKMAGDTLRQAIDSAIKNTRRKK